MSIDFFDVITYIQKNSLITSRLSLLIIAMVELDSLLDTAE
jgi:hypothetical protein